MVFSINECKRVKCDSVRLVFFIAMLFFILLPLSGKVLAADQIVPDDRNDLKEGNLYVGFPGEYVTNEYEQAKDLINQYRKEAGDYNITVSIMGNITSELSPDNVNEIVLSSSLEKCAQVRAAEASFMQDHTRPRQPGDQDSSDGNLSNCDSALSFGFESLYAYGNMISAVKAFYSEKARFDSYVNAASVDANGTKRVEITADRFPYVGHYLSMILPEYKYFGIGTFKLDGRNYYATVAEFYKPWPEEYAKYGYQTVPTDIISSPEGVTGHVIQKIETNSKRTVLNLSSEADSIEMGETISLSPSAVIRSVNGRSSKEMAVYGGIRWSGSNDSAGTVSELGIVSALQPGELTIAASCGDISAEKKLTVTKVSLASASVILSDTAFTYNGSEKRPDVASVTVKGDTLKEGSDYTVSYDNNVNAGSAKVVIAAVDSGNYKDFCEKTFTIERASIDGYRIGGISDQTYTGEPVIPQVTVSDSQETALVQGTDYTVAAENNINAGIAEVTITGTGNYTGILTGKFKISRVNLKTNDNISTGSLPALTYTGFAAEPEVSITYMNKDLIRGTDYSVTYSKNTNAGSALAVVEGMGNYEGTLELPFTISPAKLTALDGLSSRVYSGIEKTQDSLIVKAGELTAEKTGYSVEYTNNVNAGTATVRVIGNGNYTGMLTGEFEIAKVPMSDCEIEVPEQIYTGDILSAAITVIGVEGKELSTEEYQISGDASGIGAADYTFQITADETSNYTGSVEKTFTIKPAVISGCTVTIPEQSYTGQALTPAVTVSLGDRVLTYMTEYTVDYEDNINAGNAKVVVRGTGNYTGHAEGNFRIAPRQISDVDVTKGAAPIYTGDPVTVPLILKYGGKTLETEKDYTNSYSNNIKAGENTADITINGIGNFTGTREVTFSILPEDLSDGSMSELADQVYSGLEIKETPVISIQGKTLDADTDYTVQYAGDLVNAGTITVTVAGTGNYTGRLIQTYSILPVDISVEGRISEIGSVTYTGHPFTPDTAVMVGNHTLEKETDYEVSYINNTEAGSATVVVTGKGNYSGTAEQAFTIDPANLADDEISITTQDYIYTGTPVTVILSVCRNGLALQEAEDYTVSYNPEQDLTNAGRISLKAVGCGNYTGEKEAAVVISPADISSAIVTAPDQIWTGSELRPDVTVMLNGQVLPEADYTVEYSNNVSVGNASILVTPSGNGNLTGESAAGTFAIKGKAAEPQTDSKQNQQPESQPDTQQNQQPESKSDIQQNPQPEPQSDIQQNSQLDPVPTVESSIDSTGVIQKDPITIAKVPSSVKAKAKKNRVTVSWKKIRKTKKTRKLLSQIHGVQIQVSVDPAFSSIVVDRRVGKNKTRVVLKLQKKTVYYIRVRFVGSDGVSNWKTKRVRTK